MSLSNFEGHETKVIDSKTVCYCSNFDLNINEWFNEYENIEIFKLNMKKNLGNVSHCIIISRWYVVQILQRGHLTTVPKNPEQGTLLHTHF